MELYRRLVTEFLPDTLRKLPVPNSFTGIFRLSPSELASLAAFTGVSGFVAYSVFTTCRLHLDGYRSRHSVGKGTPVNWSIKKESAKVVDFVDVEDIGDKASLCRCWRSKKFPYCDGSHTQHNADTCDNVGPVVVKK